jgi:hypothetical protein
VTPPRRLIDFAARAHQKGTAYEWTREEAREAGRKSGRMSRGHPVETVNEASSIDVQVLSAFVDRPAAVCLNLLTRPHAGTSVLECLLAVAL